ncbi:HPr kinase/phosphorylase [Kiloniella sp. b19]|uniref:HPr kinase/phosphorylase n=1 Tax=Kiloniella sp. GXU_MW_B19 TaxID=3141326 RepID=UPI0031D66324
MEHASLIHATVIAFAVPVAAETPQNPDTGFVDWTFTGSPEMQKRWVGVLLRGESGSGKSDLALRCLERGAVLVADDQVGLALRNETVIASAPTNLQGLLEVRGLGIIRLEQSLERVELVGVADLQDPNEQRDVERMPDFSKAGQRVSFLGCSLPKLEIRAFEASAALKLEIYAGFCAALSAGRRF